MDGISAEQPSGAPQFVRLVPPHATTHSDSDALIAVRAASWQATDARDETLFAHLRGYSQARPLFEALRGTCAAADEWTAAGSAAERVWPLVMDAILDAADASRELIHDRCWGKYVLSGLMLNPSYKQILTMEQLDVARPWRNHACMAATSRTMVAVCSR